MKSIYEKLLGDTYQLLHPKLQDRYRLTGDAAFTGKGQMDEVSGGSYLVRAFLRLGVRFRLLFPERGNDIPFVIHNKVSVDESGQEVVHWDRTFSFSGTKRHFDAVMIWDEEQEEIVDLFGKPPLLISSLSLHVDDKGAMHIASRKQWLPVRGMRIPLPGFLYGTAQIVESYDEERACFCIRVNVRNPLVGTVFAYNGTFTETDDGGQGDDSHEA